MTGLLNWAQRNPVAAERIHRVARWKVRHVPITWQEYLALKKAQRNRCAICNRYEKRRAPSGKRIGLSVDHTHDRRRLIRGLLCSTCNWYLGWFERFQHRIESYVRKDAVALR